MQNMVLRRVLRAPIFVLTIFLALVSSTCNSAVCAATPGAIVPFEGLYDGDSSTTDHSNYLADVTQQGRARWPLAKMPLKLFIENGSATPGFRDDYPDFVRHAFNEWQKISGNRLSWIEVNTPSQADITCSWTAQVKSMGAGRVEAGETQTVIKKMPYESTGTIVGARVYILTSVYGRSFSDTDTYKTCLHEIGHALGFQGHSSTASDIMYPALNPNQIPHLTQRDRNTITALYSGASDADRIAGGSWQRPGFGNTPYRRFPRWTPNQQGFNNGSAGQDLIPTAWQHGGGYPQYGGMGQNPRPQYGSMSQGGYSPYGGAYAPSNFAGDSYSPQNASPLDSQFYAPPARFDDLGPQQQSALRAWGWRMRKLMQQ